MYTKRHHMQTTLCSFVCCCYWNMGIDLLYWIKENRSTYGGYVQFVCSPNYRFEPQRSNEARVKKSEQKLNLQAMNKPVLYGSLYFKLTNFVWFTCTNPLQDIWAKGTVQNLLIDRPVSQLTKRYSGMMKHTSLYIF